MRTVEVEYLEHGKLFKNGRASDFHDLAYTVGINRYSNDLRDTIGLDFRTSFSSRPGNVSFAFMPVFGKSRYAFVQFQSRFENEFSGSTTNRPFFQTKLLLFDTGVWHSLYEQGLSVLPSLFPQKNDATVLLNNYSSVVGNVGKSLSVQIFESDKSNNLFFQLGHGSDEEYLQRITVLADAVLKYKDVGEINIHYNVSLYEKLMLIDAVMRILLPVIHEPVSFALDPVCTAKVMLRFGESPHNRQVAYELDFSSDTRHQTEGTMNELVHIFAESTENWNDLHKNIYSSFSSVASLRRAGEEVSHSRKPSSAVNILEQARQEKELRDKESKP